MGGRSSRPGTLKGVSTWLVSADWNPERGKVVRSEETSSLLPVLRSGVDRQGRHRRRETYRGNT